MRTSGSTVTQKGCDERFRRRDNETDHLETEERSGVSRTTRRSLETFDV